MTNQEKYKFLSVLENSSQDSENKNKTDFVIN